MITLKQIADVLRNYKKECAISDIKIAPDGYACSLLENRIDSRWPYTLTVHPIVDKQVLRIRIPKIAEIGPGSMAIEALLMTNAELTYGCVGIDSRNVTFQVNHVCRSDDDNDPPPEVLEKLLDGVVKSVQQVETTTLLCAMLDSGIPRNCANNILDILFPEQEDDEPGEDEPGRPSTPLSNANEGDKQTVANRRT